ncbi:MAG TPA: hypothetical protein DEP69_07145, partial [Acidimicrobiaceae bacterium]|nr:hypothetical protein [Acidimicrobiaceae bacterium]
MTAAGPHGGDEDVERLGFALPDVARIHGVVVVVLVVLAGWLLGRLGAAARRGDAARRGGAVRRGAAVLQRFL